MSSTRTSLAYFDSLAPSTIKLGLERVEAALSRLGRPERQFPAVHVAGTNGKGSTCAFVGHALAQRYRVGLYTSPHLESPTERIRLQGTPLDEATFAHGIESLRAALGDDHGLTYFEFGTVLALWQFAQSRVDIAVVETGLGGRLDATRGCSPIVSVITPIGFDHMEWLGSTLPAIATEKAGIVRAGVPLVAAKGSPEVEHVFIKTGVPLKLEGRDFSMQTGTFTGSQWQWSGLRKGLSGSHQWQNAGLALATLEVLEEKGFSIGESEIRLALAETRWPGRFERFAGPPDIILDGAHNPHGVEALLSALGEEVSAPVHLVFGVFADKAWREMIERLAPACASVTVTRAPSSRGLAPDAVKAVIPQALAVDSPADALAMARARAGNHGVVLVAGSLSLVGLIRASLR
jgi:dihydrofolate synthase / folylpolyglutamate synthase